MPARNVTRCRPKSAHELDLIDELNVVEWIPLLPGTQFKTFAKMRSAWDRHGTRILDHYLRQLPGTRPFALWALGELPMPEIRNPAAEHSPKTVIEGVVFYSPWHYFGSRTGSGGYYCGGSAWGQFQYLRQLGVIDAREAARATEWVDDREYDPTRPHRSYEPLALEDASSMTGHDSQIPS